MSWILQHRMSTTVVALVAVLFMLLAGVLP